MKKTAPSSVASQWFRAVEETGDFLGIRYGRLSAGSDEVEWRFVSHCECDGIGGFVRLLREHGATITKLPESNHPFQGFLAPLWRLVRGHSKEGTCADRRDWIPSGQAQPGPPKAVACHLFTGEETSAIRENCRSQNFTVNSFLLKHLDEAIRPEIRSPSATIPWMIPINLRGNIRHTDDTENHVSFVELRIGPTDSPLEIQRQIRHRLDRGEHRANYLLLGIGRFLSHERKVNLIRNDRRKPRGNIGSFSNLGVWDPDSKLENRDSWFFCPPVVKGQLLGAGCVTFQNRLSITMQSHQEYAHRPEMSTVWMERWKQSISQNLK